MTHTPSFADKTLAHLEWHKVLEHYARHCRGAVAKERARNLTFATTQTELALRLQRVSEACWLREHDQAAPLDELPDIRKAMHHASIGGVMEPGDLRAVGWFLETANRCRRFLHGPAASVPALFGLAASMVELPGLSREILAAIDERGQVRDDASPELFELRRRVVSLREELERKIHAFVSDSGYRELLQDDYYTIREDRYVLPIKTTRKGQVPGIVHGWSGTGQTVFIEPEAVVETNNLLKLVQADVERETHRILMRLSTEVGAEAERMLALVEALTALDLAAAAAALAEMLRASAPEVVAEPVLELRRARHALLELSGERPVPNDIELCRGKRVLVVTGPNTGGKTVVLKTAGLCTLLAHAGLHIPAAPGSRVPFVPGVFSDIGDEQSIERHLSTFSGHLTNLMAIFAGVQPMSLVLLDEIVAGTDPVQGAALAQAILESLADRGALVLVSTHYESLKVLPFRDARFRNGAMGVDPHTGAPTYHLTLDVPGASSALMTARRLGLDAAIVLRAEELAGRGERSLEQVLEQLDRETERARLERAALGAERLDLERARALAREHEVELRERLEKGLRHERDAALDEARALRDELRQMQRELRAAERERSAAELARSLQRTEEIVREVGARQRDELRAAAGPPLEAGLLRPGLRVSVLSLQREAVVVTMPDARGELDVRAGPLLVEVNVRDLTRVESAVPPGVPRASARAARAAERPRPQGAAIEPEWSAAQTAENTLDLRGQRAEDAVERTARFLDQQIARDQRVAYVIHGHGTGALKREVRAYLKTSPYARAFRPGHPHEGGDGVTAVLLR
ncbi:MAG: endonuclease MutS2 [Planctomycetota bacterium]